MIVTKHFLFTEGCSSPSYTPLGSYTPPHSKQMLINIGMGGGGKIFLIRSFAINVIEKQILKPDEVVL